MEGLSGAWMNGERSDARGSVVQPQNIQINSTNVVIGAVLPSPNDDALDMRYRHRQVTTHDSESES